MSTRKKSATAGVKRVARKTATAVRAKAARPAATRTTKKAAATRPHTHEHEVAHHHHGHECDHEHHHAHVRSQPLIAVASVRASARWYTTILDVESLAAHDPSGHDDVYDRLIAGDDLVLQLHARAAEPHPSLAGATPGQLGRGVLLWFEVDDFDATVARAKKIRAHVVEPPHVNESAGHREIWLRDPDGYVVVVASPDGEVDGGE